MENRTHLDLLPSPTSLYKQLRKKPGLLSEDRLQKVGGGVERRQLLPSRAIPEEKQLRIEDWQQKGNMGISVVRPEMQD